jgi:RNA polymerase sigma factor (sigma-70 family)
VITQQIILDKLANMARRWARIKNLDPSLTDDLVQEGYLAMLRAVVEFEGGDFGRFAFGKAKTAMQTTALYAQRDKFTDRRNCRLPIMPSDYIDMAAEETDPLAARERREQLELLMKGVEALPPRQREAIVYRYWSGMNAEEISKRMGITRDTAWNHTKAAYRNLRRAVA